ncbi:MAG TPA: hypothetical protein VJR92_05210 [Gemmatimonadaceae bacterium]|nr:hypothetical protein [Gemmatimonadaceae bacterium]
MPQFTVFLPELKLPSVEAWQTAIRDCGFDISGLVAEPTDPDDYAYVDDMGAESDGKPGRTFPIDAVRYHVAWSGYSVWFMVSSEEHRPVVSKPPTLAVDFHISPEMGSVTPVAMVAAACARAGNGVLANNETGEEFAAAEAAQYARWLAEPGPDTEQDPE